MKDYWKDLKLSDAWSNRRRFNFLMDKIESAVVGDSDLLNSLNNKCLSTIIHCKWNT